MEEIIDIDQNTIEAICLVNKFFEGDYKKTCAWFRMKNLNFGGASPARLISMNRSLKVLNFVKEAMNDLSAS